MAEHEKENHEFHAGKIRSPVSIAQSYGATRIILFGSVLQSPETPTDLDIARKEVPGWKLFELGARLEEEFDIPLDLISLHPSNPADAMHEFTALTILFG
ncbi:MAG: hypothetical protein C4527_12725 [Candidatus Omnitrophota bacterium]|jgi:predicted nucleotidyltransferase|nr:MAG: hypothetical protein C4527_12725 [Candidatus Omnitrophota bacterium]